ncbi:hypothetical protein [Brevibacillus panacihumi]|uniref:Tail fiber protein n=1 Tax=Brevibacillus panacihumi TaxID=497735 RepID=A0A3M8C9X5_9BACL|nr:hypothetical protein [Brevibacillus panacihumi]RNB72187.1 hypothetical protein EDM58_22040 [Brevibacillus panacihumi]
MIGDILRDHGLGKGINGTDKQALIDIANAADANQSVVKTNIVNALNAVSTDQVLGLTDESTWADIQAKIPLVKTGKKWATGLVGTLNNSEMRTVGGLSFNPSTIIITSQRITTFGASTATYSKEDDRWITGVGNIGNILFPRVVLPTTGTTFGTSFDVKNYESSYSFINVRWIAFE